mmetsp:Transcript_11875/g.35534  ORF Transcript_11875/g.35534 Transcript_11875/m.35534 type:complete len:507 (+) Transcript_11875:332-1852(+)
MASAHNCGRQRWPLLLVLFCLVAGQAAAQLPAPGVGKSNTATVANQTAAAASAKAIGAGSANATVQPYDPKVAADALALAVTTVTDTNPEVTQLTKNQLDKITARVRINDPKGFQAFFNAASPADTDGDIVLAILTTRVYSTFAVDNYQRYLEAHARGMNGALKLSGLKVKPRFLMQFSSLEGPFADEDNANLMREANLTEYGGFDYTYTFGMARGAKQTAPLGAPLLNVIGQYVYHAVSEAGFHPNGELFPSVSLAYAKNFTGVQQVYFNQKMDLDFELVGESLLPFIPERQTAVLLAFRNALLNTAARNYNITGYSTVPNQAGSADVLRISMKIEVSPWDWFTPAQLGAAALSNGTLKASSASMGVPFTARFLDGSMATLRRANNMQVVVTTGRDEVSPFLTPLPNTGPAAALRNRTTAADDANASANSVPVTFTVPPVSNGDNNLSGGAIAGIVIGALVAVALVIAVVFAVIKRRRGAEFDDAETGMGKPINAQMGSGKGSTY